MNRTYQKTLPKDYVVFDIETTGLYPKSDQIIEIGAIKVRDNEVVEEFDTLVKPDRPVSGFITNLTGISNDDLKDARNIEEVLPEFLSFVNEDIVIGHNVSFDIGFIKENCLNLFGMIFENDYVCTMHLSRKLFPEYRHHRLCDLAERFNIRQDVAHRALADVYTTYNCYKYMKENKDKR